MPDKKPAVLFDMGGTLEDVVHGSDSNQICGEKILSYLKAHHINLNVGWKDLMEHCEAQNKAYRVWGVEHKQELMPFELWSEWYLKDYLGADQKALLKLRIIAENLANIWERNFYHRSLRREVKPLLEALDQRGIRMGVISNTGSLSHVIENLHEYGIHHYFKDSIYLSSLSAYRKPGPQIFIEAALDLGVEPGRAVYVGDTVSRDVRGARAAGYLASIRIVSQLSAGSDSAFNTEGEEADYLVKSLLEIPAIIDNLLRK
jgi:putative hydrolase of the HAD superfamily